MHVISMPQLGETVTEGTITSWVKAVGDPVAVDDPLFEVSTEKVDTEVPSAVAGFLRAVLVPEGETVPIGTPVAVVAASVDEELDGLDGPDLTSAPAPTATRPRAAAPRAAMPGPPVPGARWGSAPGSVRSPAVRRLLAERHMGADEVAGSGRDGRITRHDVLAAAAQRDAAPEAARAPAAPEAARIDLGPDDREVPLSRARLATAEHLSRSLATAAHALVAVEVDWSAVEPVRRAAGLSYLPFVARAVVDAIAHHPHVNASFDTDRLVVHGAIHLGVAVDVDHEALVVPVVRDAQDLRLRPLAAAIADVADRARRRRLPGDATAGATFTLTNVGSHGTLLTAPIINQPQVAILSTDGVRMAPVAVRTDPAPGPGSPPTPPEQRTWGIAVHPVGNLSLSFDHRAFDGAYAAAFLARVRDVLQERDWSAEAGG